MDEQTLIDRVEEAMSTDDENREKQSAILLRTYEKASPAEQAKIDECFICICGWSLKTLINKENE